MHKPFYPFLLFVCLLATKSHGSSILSGTDSLPPKTKSEWPKHHTWMKMTDSPKVLRGAILRTTDSSIFWVNEGTRIVFAEKQATEIHCSKIKYLKFRKKNKPLNSTLGGMIGGAIFGGILGFATGDDEPGFFSFTKEEKAVMGAIFFGALGAIVGLIAGFRKEKCYVQGHPERFRALRPDIKPYTLTGQ